MQKNNFHYPGFEREWFFVCSFFCEYLYKDPGFEIFHFQQFLVLFILSSPFLSSFFHCVFEKRKGRRGKLEKGQGLERKKELLKKTKMTKNDISVFRERLILDPENPLETNEKCWPALLKMIIESYNLTGRGRC